MTSVINIKDAPGSWMYDSDYVYIGRAGQGLAGYWGNPHILTNENQREATIQLYIQYAIKRYNESAMFREMLRELRGRILVCFCAPKLCHGDILAMLADLDI